MNTILNKIAKILIVQIGLILMTVNIYAQCINKADPPGTVSGEFSINTTKVRVVGDGDGNTTAANNIPVKICEGETITLKNTINATSTTGINYWLMPLGQYTALTAPPSTPSTANASYNSIAGDISITVNNSSSWYAGPGIYVITQGDNSSIGTTNDYHHACQVIEIIKPSTPKVTYSVCNGNLISLKLMPDPSNNYDEYEVTFSGIGSLFNPTFNEKPTSYPHTVSSGPLPDFNDRIITIKGQSKTGTCPAPTYTSPSISMSGTSINRPLITSITGTTIPSEFKMTVYAQNTIQRNVFIRDPLTTTDYDYTNPLMTYTSNTTALFDNVTVTVPNPNKQYCFRTEALDAACPTTIVNPLSLSNEEVCTTPAKADAINSAIQISWAKALTNIFGGSYTDYRVERVKVDGTIDKIFPPITNISTLTLSDPDVICGKNYIYRVITNYGQKSTSQLLNINAMSTMPLTKIANVFADVDAPASTINIKGEFEAGTTIGVPDVTGILEYRFYRADSPNGLYRLLQTSSPTINLVKDATALINKQSYCYYMTWKDLCNRESAPSEKVCSVFLSSGVSVINWTPESSFSIATDYYRVNKISPATGLLVKTLADNLSNIYSFNTIGLPESEGQEIYLKIEAKPITGSINQNTHSNIVRVYRPSILLSPDAFTPNNDGVNDRFVVYGRFVQKLKMTVYDHWGNPVFYDETENFPNNTQIGWDGFLKNGEKASQGMYVYKLQVEDTTGQTINKEGTLFLTY